MKNKNVEYINLGLVDYKQAWDFQEELFKKIVDVKVNNRNNQTEEVTPNYVIFCQHPKVVNSKIYF
jgi:lipoyl(octanoyl) transferase